MGQSNAEKKRRDRDRYMSQISPDNQDVVQAHVLEHQRKGNAPGTQASQHDLAAWVVWLCHRYSPESVYHHCTCAIPVLRTALDADHVPDGLVKPLRVWRPRISEALSLRLHDVELRPEHRAFHVSLPNMGTRDGDLKSGTRTFSSVNAFGPLPSSP